MLYSYPALKVFLLLCVGVLASAAPTAHVVLIIGQSNSVGYNNEGHTNEDVAYDNIVQTSCCNNGQTTNDNCQLVAGQDPLHHTCDTNYLNGNSIGFGMSFARQLRASLPADDVIILVAAGIGGTGFVDNVWTAYNGTGFVQALTRLRNTFNLVAQKYPQHTVLFDSILWHQGEADSNTASVSDYLNKDLIPMVNAWRDTKLIPQTRANLPFVVGNLVPEWVEDTTQPQRLNILTALQLVSQYVHNTGVTPSFGLQGGQPNNIIHFTAPSQRVFGKRYFAAYLAAKLNAPSA